MKMKLIKRLRFFAAFANSNNNFYNNTLIATIGGTGAGQARFITAYNGTTKVATVTTAWVTVPDNTTVYSVVGFDLIGATVSSLTPTERNAIADALLDRDMSLGVDSGSTTVRTPRQSFRALRNKWTIAGTAYTVFKEDDAATSWTSVLTGTPGADPVTTSDPAGP